MDGGRLTGWQVEDRQMGKTGKKGKNAYLVSICSIEMKMTCMI